MTLTFKPKLLIGIHGHARSGKDTIADYLVNPKAHYYRLAFADPLKDAIDFLFGFTAGDVLNKETKHPFWGVSYREMGQFIGTEIFREIMVKQFQLLGSHVLDDTSFWIKRMEFTLENYAKSSPEIYSKSTIIISDVRFQDEAQWIVDNGGYLLHVTRESATGEVGISGHASEAGIDWSKLPPIKCWGINNNGSLEQLYQSIDMCIEQIVSMQSPEF